MKEKKGKKRMTDAQTAYLRSEIKKLKKRWAVIRGSDDSQNSGADLSNPGNSESASCSTGNAAINNSSSDSSDSSLQTSAGESGSTNTSGQEDENDSRRMPSLLNFPDEMFEYTTSDTEEVLEGLQPILHESVDPGSETYNVPSTVHTDADDEASSLIPFPAELNFLNTGEEEFLLSGNNLNYFSNSSAPSQEEFPELENSFEVLRNCSKDTYRSNSLNFEFNPTAFSSPKPDRIDSLLRNVAESKGGCEFQLTETGSMRGNEALLYSKSELGTNRQKPDPSTTSSAVDFSVYPTPIDTTTVSEVASDQYSIELSEVREHTQPAATSSRPVAAFKPDEAMIPKGSKQKGKAKARSVKKRKAKKPKKAAVKTMARALPKELERRQKKIRFTCEACIKSFSTRGQLQYHVHNSHKTFELVCKMCHKTDFGSQRILARHMRTCEVQVKSFVCQTCEDRFEDNVQLTLHSSIHEEPTKAFVCETCSSEFQDEASFKKHFSSEHQKSQRFQCHACDRNYATKHGLRRHILKQHPGNKPDP